MFQVIKAAALLAAAAMFLSLKVHAATSNVHVKEQPAPPTYAVDGKQVSSAEATIAILQGKKAFKCVEMEVDESRTGLSLKAKKAN